MTEGFTGKDKKFHPTGGSKGSVSEKDFNVSVKGSNDTILVDLNKKLMVKPNYLNVEDKLRKVFNTRNVEYHKKDDYSKNYIFFMNVKELTPEIISKWTRTFPEGSYYSVAKGVDQNSLSVTVDVSEDDFKRNGF